MMLPRSDFLKTPHNKIAVSFEFLLNRSLNAIVQTERRDDRAVWDRLIRQRRPVRLVWNHAGRVVSGIFPS